MHQQGTLTIAGKIHRRSHTRQLQTVLYHVGWAGSGSTLRFFKYTPTQAHTHRTNHSPLAPKLHRRPHSIQFQSSLQHVGLGLPPRCDFSNTPSHKHTHIGPVIHQNLQTISLQTIATRSVTRWAFGRVWLHVAIFQIPLHTNTNTNTSDQSFTIGTTTLRFFKIPLHTNTNTSDQSFTICTKNPQTISFQTIATRSVTRWALGWVWLHVAISQIPLHTNTNTPDQSSCTSIDHPLATKFNRRYQSRQLQTVL